MALSSDPHPASEAVIRSGGGGQAGERSQKPAEDVPHHVYSSSTAHLHVLAHLPPHQIKPHTRFAEDELGYVMPSQPLKNTHTQRRRSCTWMKSKTATVWMMSHYFPDVKTKVHIRLTTIHVKRRLGESAQPSLTAQPCVI